MAKDNPIDVYRRQQRKKELKKNKNARIKARDAKVAATRTVEEVKSEISLLERKRDRNDAKTGLNSDETKKLERLQKELRIVSAESVKRKAEAEAAAAEREKELIAAQRTVEGVQKLNESKYGLVERYASVYYDEKLNPFGAPAPGQPKLYYADEDGKTTTMDSRRAVVPSRWRAKFESEGGKQRGGAEVSEDVQALRGVKRRRWDDPGDGSASGQQMMPVAPPPPPMHPAAQQFVPPPPPAFPPPPPHPPQTMPPPPPPQVPQPPPPPAVPPPPPPPPPPPLPPKDKTQPPALPAPSKAVLRAAKRSTSGKRAAMADIWASQEEIEYESSLGGGNAIEGTLDQLSQQQQPYMPRWKRNKMKAKSNGSDGVDGTINDPCCPSADGYGEYRNTEQIERQSKEVQRLQKQQNEHAARQVAANETTPPTQQRQEQPSSWYNVQQPIWYYRDNTSGAVQGPFSGEQMMGWKSFFPVTTPVRFGHDGSGAFVALSEVDFTKSPVPPPPPPQPPSPPPQEEPDTTPQEYFADNDEAAVDEEGVAQEAVAAKDDDAGPEVDVCLPPPSDDEDEGDDARADEGGDYGPEVDVCVPPPSEDEGDDREDDADGPEVDACVPPPSDDEADDHIDNADGQEVDMCVPPPSDDEVEEEAEVQYPAVGEYPLPSDDAVPYPVDVEYPVDDAYGYPDTDEAYGGGEMAAVAPYPSAEDVVFGVAEDIDQGEAGQPREKKEEKKQYKGDKDVVGFVPSHLRVKRKVAQAKKPKPAALPAVRNDDGKDQGYSVADDYNKFMEEISGLGKGEE